MNAGSKWKSAAQHSCTAQVHSTGAVPDFPPAGTAPLSYGVLQDIRAGFSMAVGSGLAGAVAGTGHLTNISMDPALLSCSQSDLT